MPKTIQFRLMACWAFGNTIKTPQLKHPLSWNMRTSL